MEVVEDLWDDIKERFSVTDGPPIHPQEFASSRDISMSGIEPPTKSPPPWLVLCLVARRLDPRTLTIASCVCKLWSICMSSDHLWQPICSALYPSLSNLHAAYPTVSFHRLFALGCTAQRRRLQKPRKPRISLDDLTFAVDIYNRSSCSGTIVKAGNELRVDDNKENLLFRFDIGCCDVGDRRPAVVVEELDELRITWNVVLKGLKSVFTMMDCRGKGRVVMGLEGWFSKELPPCGCCSGSSSASGLAADLRLGLKESGKRAIVEKVSVGVMNIVSWRYASIDDTLRYLQHFLVHT